MVAYCSIDHIPGTVFGSYSLKWQCLLCILMILVMNAEMSEEVFPYEI